jgi:hypothetical protein
MVRAILEGRKTQTRRIVRWPEWVTEDEKLKISVSKAPGFALYTDGVPTKHHAPFGSPGDHLWIRETWCHKADDGVMVYNADGNLDSSCVHFAADGADVHCIDDDGFTAYNADGSSKSPWKPSIHMPRWASRINLEITSIRIERLKSISQEDARAEGVPPNWGSDLTGWNPDEHGFIAEPQPDEGEPYFRTAIDAYAFLWDSINAKRTGFRWDDNPFVYVIKFKRLEKGK